MALGAFLVLPQLPLHPLPRLRVNARRHRHGHPLARRPPGPALGIPRDPVFVAAPAIGLAHLPHLGPVVIGFAFIEGVAEDLDETTLRPAPLARRAGDDPLPVRRRWMAEELSCSSTHQREMRRTTSASASLMTRCCGVVGVLRM